MRSSALRSLVAALLMALAVVGCSEATGESTTTTVGDVPPAVGDGTWFAFVTVGEDETRTMTLGIDLAEMLSGEEARRAAVEDGAIAEGEDLPNDFYIDNDTVVMELLHVSDDAVFTFISGEDTTLGVEVDGTSLAQIYDGTYTGQPLYGVVPNAPIAMDVEVQGGLVVGAAAVYLP